MRAVTEYRQRARECRELARMVDKLEDKYKVGKGLLRVANTILRRTAELFAGPAM
jgi:uncharacterized protein YaaW (UPF0174 family)